MASGPARPSSIVSRTFSFEEQLGRTANTPAEHRMRAADESEPVSYECG